MRYRINMVGNRGKIDRRIFLELWFHDPRVCTWTLYFQSIDVQFTLMGTGYIALHHTGTSVFFTHSLPKTFLMPSCPGGSKKVHATLTSMSVLSRLQNTLPSFLTVYWCVSVRYCILDYSSCILVQCAIN